MENIGSSGMAEVLFLRLGASSVASECVHIGRHAGWADQERLTAAVGRSVISPPWFLISSSCPAHRQLDKRLGFNCSDSPGSTA